MLGGILESGCKRKQGRRCYTKASSVAIVVSWQEVTANKVTCIWENEYVTPVNLDPLLVAVRSNKGERSMS